jgi:hypothetical protein
MPQVRVFRLGKGIDADSKPGVEWIKNLGAQSYQRLLLVGWETTKPNSPSLLIPCNVSSPSPGLPLQLFLYPHRTPILNLLQQTGR